MRRSVGRVGGDDRMKTSKLEPRATRLIVLLCALLAALVSIMIASCGGNDGSCTLGDDSSCADGQVCAAGKNGTPGCFACSTANNHGCKGGQVCAFDQHGAPACVCSIQ